MKKNEEPVYIDLGDIFVPIHPHAAPQNKSKINFDDIDFEGNQYQESIERMQQEKTQGGGPTDSTYRVGPVVVPGTTPATSDNTRVFRQILPPRITIKTKQKPHYTYKGYPFTSPQEFIESSYYNWYYTLTDNGFDEKTADRLAGYLALQDGLESGYGTSTAATHNNFGGMRYKGKNIEYKSVEKYYQDKFAMIIGKMPHVLNAQSDEEFVDLLNSGTYQYAPPNENSTYKRDFLNMKLARIYLEDTRKNRQTKTR